MAAVLLTGGISAWLASGRPGSAQGPAGSRGEVVPGFVVHEWGTFTSFSGSDGVPVQFRPLVEQDLPPFVNKHPSLMFSKGTMSALQRIETPVTYFYPPREMDVSANVRISKGMLTEYFPRVKFSLDEPGLVWDGLHLIPSKHFIVGQEIGRWESISGENIQLPEAAKFPHYDRARATDAAIVRRAVYREASDNTPALPDDLEKFLFYRGLGNFPLPVSVRSVDGAAAEIHNSGPHPLAAAFLVTVGSAGINSRPLGPIAAGERRTVPLSGDMTTVDRLSADMTSVLVADGLFPKEADAMVAAWKDSWFAEPGTRLFYLLPQAVTDEILPLTVTPAPEKTVRVMVGRLEIMTPSQEQQVLATLTDLAAQRTLLSVSLALDGTRQEPAPPEIRRLGRLAIPVLNRAAALSGDEAVKMEAARLVETLSVVGAGAVTDN